MKNERHSCERNLCNCVTSLKKKKKKKKTVNIIVLTKARVLSMVCKYWLITFLALILYISCNVFKDFLGEQKTIINKLTKSFGITFG